MPLFPACIDLSRAKVLVVGEGHEAELKAQRMAPFCETVLRCPYPPVYDEPPALVILAEKEHPDNECWAEHFRALHIPVNVADRPELCDFVFPSLIVRGDATIAIATAGKAPALSMLLRQKIEDALPEDLEAILDTAAAITAELRQSIPDPHERGKAIRERLRELL
ncbi:MAG: hypothetical protein IJO05_01245 [Oscillospiraceae bacterium]|nr:hypothetical protein [Oscillospiraceae bacterium]